jgi:hypothetical protein
MANSNAPKGLVPVRHAHGQPYTGACNKYYVDDQYGTAIFVGDPVALAAASDADGVPGVEVATAGTANPILGVVVGVVPDPDNLTRRHLPASTGGYVLVADEPGLLFEIQEDSTGGALAAADIGLNCNLASGTGSTYTGLSGWQLDTSEKDTTAADQVQIVGIVQRPDNAFGVNAKVLVKINNHQAAQGRTGV